jgi:hypothetical protein
MNIEAFETIYNECNPAVESACLESPINTTSKLSMSFEDIYFECNLMPLFKRILREADDSMENNEQPPLSKTQKIARYTLGSPANIIKNEAMEFTEENYRKELGGEISTPLGNVKMSEDNWGGGAKNSFQKMSDKPNRKKDIFKARWALEDPSIIIKLSDFQDRYMYAKVFDDADLGGKERQVFYAIVDNSAVIRDFNRERLRIRNFVGKYIASPENLFWHKK